MFKRFILHYNDNNFGEILISYNQSKPNKNETQGRKTSYHK